MKTGVYTCKTIASEFGFSSRHHFAGNPVYGGGGPVSTNPFVHMDAHPIPRRTRPALDVGREMVHRREFGSLNQLDDLCLIRYWQQQREQVERRGQCDGGCDRTESWTTPAMNSVCPFTFEPCERQRLSLIARHLARLGS